MIDGSSFFISSSLRHLRFGLLVTALICIGPTAWAQAGANCDPQSLDLESTNACAVQRFQEIDTAQNILYADVMRALSAQERPDLRREQTLWSRQRTTQCKSLHAAEEGHDAWMARYHDCLSASTQARQADLMHWLHHGQPPRP